MKVLEVQGQDKVVDKEIERKLAEEENDSHLVT